ncbi:DedA family protein [Marinomonas mediterranea]|uniref:YqaA family protein n=1 Tax=Marinomonas mediterranea TaxID=119864 RepID=UPI000A0023D9|nr:YqaA family protein [Marinomonas mediterranea]WCN15527.1 DedA family protein [Marinomonas mediterranea]WCN18392.1 DedA family protein [Marinomonas mediterranea MMB-1]
MLDLLSLFSTSFLSSTILPGGSEALLLYLTQTSTYSLIALWVIASVGNTLGGLTNWLLGRYLYRFKEHRLFPISSTQLNKATHFFHKYGTASLLFSWLPIIGDALCILAGVSRVRLFIFFVLVLFGKSARYAILLLGVEYL